jgi:hypothetical protein
MGDVVGRGHFGYICAAKVNKGACKGEHHGHYGDRSRRGEGRDEDTGSLCSWRGQSCGTSVVTGCCCSGAAAIASACLLLGVRSVQRGDTSDEVTTNKSSIRF